MTSTIPESARLATPYQQRTLCPACRHYHRPSMAHRCSCCSEKPGYKKKRGTQPKPPPPGPPPPPVLIPHIWEQSTGIGVTLLAGQIWTGDGRPARLKANGNFKPAPIHLQPNTEAGMNQLASLLQTDISRALNGAT